MAIELVYLSDNTRFLQLCAVWAFKTWGRYNHEFTLEKRVESFKQHSQKKQIPFTILALDDGRAVGMASLRPNDGIRPDLTPWLGSVFVDPLLRNKGIGQLLVEEVCRLAKELGYPKVYLLTYEDSLPSWYSRLGWRTISRDVCHGHSVSVMEIELNQWMRPTAAQPATNFAVGPGGLDFAIISRTA